jgi:hypothetical protein
LLIASIGEFFFRVKEYFQDILPGRRNPVRQGETGNMVAFSYSGMEQAPGETDKEPCIRDDVLMDLAKATAPAISASVSCL